MSAMNKGFIFTLLTAALLFVTACKKENTSEIPTPTDLTGEAVITGVVTKPIITSDGAGGWSTGTVPAKNTAVAVTVAKASLYPNSSALGADTYSQVTDSNGVYRIKIKSNAGGVLARVTIEGSTATLDTLINSTVKKGNLCIYTGVQSNVNVAIGQSGVVNWLLSAAPFVQPNALKTGTAVISGSIGVTYYKEVIVGSNTLTIPVIVPYPSGHPVYLKLQNDPLTQSPKLYFTTTDGNSAYSFVITTLENGTTGFVQDATIWAEDLYASQDTIKLNGTVKKGLKGVFQKESRNENGIFINDIRNARHLTYSSFNAD
jgi:hypothetical protein